MPEAVLDDIDREADASCAARRELTLIIGTTRDVLCDSCYDQRFDAVHDEGRTGPAALTSKGEKLKALFAFPALDKDLFHRVLEARP